VVLMPPIDGTLLFEAILAGLGFAILAAFFS
jgi:hypothetical protein